MYTKEALLLTACYKSSYTTVNKSAYNKVMR